MTKKTAFAWYRLFQAEGFGPKAMYTIWKALQESGLPLERLFEMERPDFESRFPSLGKGRLKRAGFDALHAQDEDKLYEEYQNLRDDGVEIVHPGHPLCGEKLLGLVEYGAFPILFCKGRISLLKSQGVAIVGSRNASEEGMRIARQFAADLALAGENVVSGYAKGIDTSAHEGALEKDGTTTIVLSHGILQFSKRKVFDKLVREENVLVVSQFHPGEGWSAGNAMIRNRLVCALSKAVIVVECGAEMGEDGNMSGTFDAGKTALQMKIPLFVLSPDSFKKPAAGNKALIDRGGIEIQPKDGVAGALQDHEVASKKRKESTGTGEQLALF
jgi:DNA processing protein